MSPFRSISTLLIATLMQVVSIAALSATLQSAEPEAPLNDASPGVFLGGVPPSNGPVLVTVNFDLREIDHIDDDEETIEFTGVLKTTWRDPRQAFDPVAAGTGEKIFQGSYQFDEVYAGWYPQLILVNESGLYEKQGVLLRVSSDGSISMFETINAVAKIDLDLRVFPVDEQRLEAVFHVLGFSSDEIRLQVQPAHQQGIEQSKKSIRMPQWKLKNIEYSTGTRYTPLIGPEATASTFAITMDLQRSSFFIMRLVVLPLIVIVILSWSVFWMDTSSLGDRLSVSFIGILTAVTYQVILSEILPRISYATLMNDGFLVFSFLTMAATVFINLRVGYLDRHGMCLQGDRLDQVCRWIFPITYFAGLIVFFLLSRLI